MMKTPNLFTFSDSVENNEIVYANQGDTNEVMSNPAATTVDQQQPISGNHNSAFIEQATGAAGLRTLPSKNAVSSEPESTNSQSLQKLVLPWSEKYWNLFITNPKSTVEIWARLIGAEYSVSHTFFNSNNIFII